MTRVLLVEDHASFRQAIAAVLDLEDDLEPVGHAEHADAVADAVAATSADLVLVDLDLPGGGVRAIKDVRARCPRVACVVLSAMNDDVLLGEAVEAGAAAVLHKSVDIPELLDVLRTVARGGKVLPADETSRRLRALAASRDQDWRARVMREVITPREQEILELLVEGADNRRIAQWLGISPQTVQTHVRNVLAKFDAGSRLEAVAEALRLGLVDPPR